MNEIKATFPEYSRYVEAGAPTTSSSSSTQSGVGPPVNDALATSNFADHALRRLQLPPVAEASIRTLTIHCREEQINLGRNSGTKLSTMCAAVAFFVSSAGSIMQRLAQQVQSQQEQAQQRSNGVYGKKKKRGLLMTNQSSNSQKRLKVSPSEKPTNADTGKSDIAKRISIPDKDSGEESDDDMGLTMETKRSATASMKKDSLSEDEDEEPFDVFSHAPIVEDRSEKQKYEMRRMWDAWSEQMPWARSVVEVEQSCGVSRNVVMDFYKSDLYPRRELLLGVLQDAILPDDDKSNNNKKEASSLQDTPLAPILLVHISTAASLMISK
jgi:hypothetical protein